MYLKNYLHEQFAFLIAEGHSATGAYRLLKPLAKNPHTLGAKLMKRHEVARRIDEIREEVAAQSIMTLAHKRDELRKMILGIIPSKITKTHGPKGTIITEEFDFKGSIELDAKLAGEFATERHVTQTADSLKLTFNIPSREEVFDANFEIVRQPYLVE